MKLFLKRNLLGNILTGACLAVCLLGVSQSPAQLNSPVGTWDCLSSGGGQPGIAFLTFSDDYTFSGNMIVAGMPPTPKNDSRNSGSTGRGDSNSNTNAVATTNLFGYWAVEGPWGYDIKGRVIGSFVQVIKVAPEVTVNWNTMTVDTGPISFPVYDYGVGLVTMTNSVSFFVDSRDGTLGYRDTVNFWRTFDGPFSTRTYNWTAINTFDGYTNNYTANITFFNVTNLLEWSTTNFSFTFKAPDLTTNISWSVVGPNGYINNYSIPFYASNSLGYSLSGVVTNTVSFVGTVKPNKRLTLLASTSLGGNKLTYSGVPINPGALTDIEGIWNGAKTEGGVNYTEFFAVTPSVEPYLFFADGSGAFPSGPGYNVNGYIMISSKKKIAFAQWEQPWGSTNAILRASTGTLSTSTRALSAKTKGVSENGPSLKFNATLPKP